jgi:hypothetical protein
MNNSLSHISGKKKNLAAIALLSLLICSTAFAAMPLAAAHDPPWTIPTYAYVVASPDPVGVGQPVFLVFWLDKVPPTAGGTGGDRWTDFTLKITKPDGSVENRGPYISDATSAAWDIFYPQQEGVYSILFEYPGQTASLYHPETGIRGSDSDFVNDSYTGSSATTTFTVQSEQVRESPTYPLPSSFWTRPIEGQNTQWSYIASNYLGGGSIIDKVQPNGKAPGSAHVMWTKTFQDGGIIGGDYWGVPSAAYYTGLSYEGKFNNPIIINGRLYYKAALSNSQTAGPYMCVDLLTGETIWENNDINPTFGMIYLYESMNQHGAMEGYLVQTSGTTWRIFDSRTGIPLFNMTGVPSGFGGGFFGGSGSGVVGEYGEILNYQLNVNGRWLALWSSAAEPNTPLVLTPGNTTNAFQYRPVGKNADMSQAYLWNITIPALPAGSTIQKVIRDDMLLISTSPTPQGMMFGFGTQEYTVTALGLNEDNLGQILWQKTYQPPTGNKTISFGPIDPVNRVFTMTEKETMQWIGYDLDSGVKLWGPVGDFRDFQYYGQVSNPPAPGHIYDGKLIVGGYGGELHCFDTLSGNLEWVYNDTYCGTETPWGLYTLFVAGIADGKVYAYSSEHSPNVPLYKGSQMRCISVEDGSELWTLDSWYAIGSFGQSPVPIADGYMAYLNVYDMQVYCIGKGPSKLTVEAPLSGIALGQSMVIKGTVEDISAGAKAKVASGEFNIVPAVSDASQGEWMRYIYMQKPCPDNATGVPVTIFATDANGHTEQIATVTSDASGLFYYKWVPSQVGTYMITAVFDGSESYWPSSSTTAVSVDEAASAPIQTPTPTTSPSETTSPTESPTQTVVPSPTPAVEPDSDFPTETVLIVVAAVVIIAVIGAAAVLLRKRA